MGGLFGGGASTPPSSPVTSLRLQTSTRGRPVPLAYGKPRIAANLIWYGDFVATGHTESAGGKGGSQPTSTTYTYTASVLMGLCEGAINAIPRIWRQKEVFVGEISQAVPMSVQDESWVVPPAPFKVRVVNSATFISNLSVYILDDRPSPLGGFFMGRFPLEQGKDYQVDASGNYTFLPIYAGTLVFIGYTCNQAQAVSDACGKIGMTLSRGTYSQNPQGWLSSRHPTETLAYRGIAYVSASNYALGGNGDMLNHSFEIDTQSGYSTEIRDANPKDVIVDLLTNPYYGAGFPAEKIGDMSAYSNYCIANNIFISPLYLDQSPVRDMLTTLMALTNSGAVYSDGRLKILPFGDVSASANNVTFLPNSQPVYDLNDDDFLGDSGDDPVQVTRKSQADSYNSVRIKFYNRNNDYNEEIVEAKDDASIAQFGLRAMDVQDMKEICDPTVARNVAQILLQRSLYIRNQYTFKCGWSKALLEPMDLVTLTDPGMGMNRFLVRITSVEEDEEGELTFTAEEAPQNVYSAARYPSQQSIGYSSNNNAVAPSVSPPVIFEPPLPIANGLDQLWIAAAAGGNKSWGGADVWLSVDGNSYKKIGQIISAARYGFTTSTLPAGANPEVQAQLGVDLSESGGTLMSASQRDVDAFTTLCWIDGELVAYRDATLVSAAQYKLSYIRRAGGGTKLINHNAGSTFVRLDESIFQWTIPSDMVGKRVFIKLASFNVFGGGTQDLSAIVAYEYVINGTDQPADNLPRKVIDSASVGTTKQEITPETLSVPSITGLGTVRTSLDDKGNIVISFQKVDDPGIQCWEMRMGKTFETGTWVAQTKEDFFLVPVIVAASNQYWIRPLYSGGNYGILTYFTAFSGALLANVTGLTMRINEPMLNFTWDKVEGAQQYITYFEEGGVSTMRVSQIPALSAPIPKYTSNLRIYAVAASGNISAPLDQPIAMTGSYRLNEIVNIHLPMNQGQFVNMAFTNAQQVEQVSLLGPASISLPVSSVNNSALFSFGYNLKDVSVNDIKSVPASWFRQDFWKARNGYFESASIDLGKVLTGRLKLAIEKTVTPYGNGSVSAYAQVSSAYLADSLCTDVIDKKAFLGATFYTSASGSGDWVPMADGDWAIACRYVKIIVKADRVSPLTDVQVTTGTLTLDVPDITESGTAKSVSSSGLTVQLVKDWNVISVVMLTPKSNCKVWATITGANTFTVYTDATSSVDVSYFVKGY